MKKTYKVVMLPSNKPTMLEFDEYKQLWLNPELQHDNNPDTVQEYQHLYFISDEKIKIGDWVYDKLNKTIHQVDSAYSYRGYPKIIATTNEDIWKSASSNYSRENGVWGCDKIDESFVKDFHSAYNDDNPITEVELDYKNLPIGEEDEYSGFDNWEVKLKTTDDGYVIVKSPINRTYTRADMVNAISYAVAHPNITAGEMKKKVNDVLSFING